MAIPQRPIAPRPVGPASSRPPLASRAFGPASLSSPRSLPPRPSFSRPAPLRRFSKPLPSKPAVKPPSAFQKYGYSRYQYAKIVKKATSKWSPQVRKLRMTPLERAAEQKRLMDLAGKKWRVRVKDIKKALRREEKERRRRLYGKSLKAIRVERARKEFLEKTGEFNQK